MNIKHISALLLLLAALLLPAAAQSGAGRGRSAKPAQQQQRKPSARNNVKNQKKDGRPRAHAAEEKPDPLTAELLRSTQRLLVFDSLVVDADQWARQLPLGTDQGRVTTYDSFFGSSGHPGDMLYVNGLGNMCVFSRKAKDGSSQLCGSDLLAGKWSNAAPLRGLAEKGRFTQMSCPFLMSDGVTLFFAAKGDETLGGWDLFRSTRNTTSGRYMRAESMGLPFCSTGDDLLLAYNETDSIGMLVSNRTQPDGRVCIYFFLPTVSHQTYDWLSPESDTLRQMATLSRISLTWQGREAERQRAAERLTRLRQTLAAATDSDRQADISFFVRDGLTYTSAKQFRSPGGLQRYRQMEADRQRLAQLKTQTARQRQRYAAKPSEQMAAAILKNEAEMEQMERRLEQQEKELRNAENQP